MDKIRLILIFTLYVLNKRRISDDNPYKLKLRLDFLFLCTTILQLTLKTSGVTTPATPSTSCYSKETVLHTYKPVFMYRHRIRETKALGKCKSCHLSGSFYIYTPHQELQSSNVLHTNVRGIFPWPSDQAQKEYLKQGRRKSKTANSIARLNLELLKNPPI